MGGGWQISVGDVYETMRPALFALAALCSVLVLADARRHGGFRRYAAWAWTLTAFVSPPVVLPLYLVARMYTPRPSTTLAAPESDPHVSHGDDARPGVGQGVGESPGEESAARGATPGGAGFALPLLYAAALALAGAYYFYRDYRSFDAHLARAAREKLNRRAERAIGEYRAALGVRDDAHTRKLLGLELLGAGRAEEALAELRAAERGGEPDEMLAYHIGSALEAAGRRDEAASSFEAYLRSGLCARTPSRASCEGARARVRQREGAAAP